jgi:hypothetical protein
MVLSIAAEINFWIVYSLIHVILQLDSQLLVRGLHPCNFIHQQDIQIETNRCVEVQQDIFNLTELLACRQVVDVCVKSEVLWE